MILSWTLEDLIEEMMEDDPIGVETINGDSKSVYMIDNLREIVGREKRDMTMASSEFLDKCCKQSY